jgi:hypothetical protein
MAPGAVGLLRCVALLVLQVIEVDVAVPLGRDAGGLQNLGLAGIRAGMSR